jgi:transposase
MPKGKPKKQFTGEFKQQVVEKLRSEGLSYKEAMQQFNISGHNSIQSWERIYLEEGPEGLYIERRGRGSKGRPSKLDKRAEEDLIGENQRLRAENEYLKNLQALVLESEQHRHKKRR